MFILFMTLFSLSCCMAKQFVVILQNDVRDNSQEMLFNRLIAITRRSHSKTNFVLYERYDERINGRKY